MSETPPLREDLHKIFCPCSARPDRLIHLIPDELAEVVPHHALFSFPKTTKVQDGFIDVSCKSFANAVNRTSWHLESLLGKSKDFDAVGYMGPSMSATRLCIINDSNVCLMCEDDIRYFLLMFAAIKVGYKVYGTLSLLGHY